MKQKMPNWSRTAHRLKVMTLSNLHQSEHAGGLADPQALRHVAHRSQQLPHALSWHAYDEAYWARRP
jgi:hypothetical protein